MNNQLVQHNLKIDIFHIGPQKTATTWVYRALSEHPEMLVSQVDSVHYFDMNYEDDSWLTKNYQDIVNAQNKLVFDPTYTYIRSIHAPQRIYDHNKDAKIMLTARNPVERAFSHYWHERKKDRFNFAFDEVFKNFDLYANWVEPGFYHKHYLKYREYFSEDQIRILFYDDLVNDPCHFFAEICEFCGIDSGFKPSILNRKVNVASVYKSRRSKMIETKVRSLPLGKTMLKLKSKLTRLPLKESLSNVDAEIKRRLYDLFIPDIVALEATTSRDLSHWKREI